MIRVYLYRNCSTCKNAVKWLTQNGIDFEEIAIRETPPNPAELAQMVAAYDGKLTRVFNTSSQDYRDARLKDRLPTLTHDQAFALQQTQGNLVKRPFVIGDGIHLLGFKPDEWAHTFDK